MNRLLLLLLSFPAAQAADFWVWHRGGELPETERAALVKGGCRTLYWHGGGAGGPLAR
jgi:hypothetical protein